MVKMNSYVASQPQDIEERLTDLVGKTVCVSWVKDKKGFRKNFEPQISVQGTLEGSPETGKFRVLLTDNTFSYFYNDTVWWVTHDIEKDKRAVIFIN